VQKLLSDGEKSDFKQARNMGNRSLELKADLQRIFINQTTAYVQQKYYRWKALSTLYKTHSKPENFNLHKINLQFQTISNFKITFYSSFYQSKHHSLITKIPSLESSFDVLQNASDAAKRNFRIESKLRGITTKCVQNPEILNCTKSTYNSKYQTASKLLLLFFYQSKLTLL
jgi:hypothetical protein